MKPLPPTLVTAGAMLVAVLSVFATMDYYRIAAISNEQQADIYRVSYQEPRFRAVMAGIPPDAIVGYHTNLESGSLRDDVAFRGAQYAFAPRLLRRVENGDYGEYAVGNYTAEVETRDMIISAARDFSLEPVQQLDTGVVLYRRLGDQ